MKRVVHAIAPRRLVNFAWNLAADLSEIGQRVADPRPRPWRVIHNVGGGDFYATGEAFFALFQGAAGLKTDACVLDIGCGAGRLAFPICSYLGPRGRYIGFDIAPRALDFARAHVRGDCGIELVHAELANAEYARRGEPADAYRFPAADASVDAALATSLFSHILPDVAVHYLSEAGRVLKPGGRFMLTAFLVTQADRERLAAARLGLQPYGEMAFAADPRHPERAIGFDEPSLLSWVEAAGLTVAGDVHRGDWRAPTATGGEFQDRLVLEKV
jgi:SAM-dependent methyltransferase